MAPTALVPLVLAALVAPANWASRALGHRGLEYATKPTVTALLVAAALALQARDPVQQRWFAAAVALSLVGDVLLMLPGDRFVGGLAAFLLAHLAYVAGFWAAGVDAVPLAVGVVIVLALATPLALRVVGALRRSGNTALVPPVLVYLAAITAMVASAAGSGSALAVAGAGVFLVSDATLAWDRFVAPLRWAPVGVMVTYHLGQAGLVLSLAV